MDFQRTPDTGNEADLDAFADHGSSNVLLSFVIPIVLIFAGVHLILGRELPWLPTAEFRNSDKYAVGFGITAIGAAIFLHFRIFWQHRRPDVWYTQLGIAFGLLVLLGGSLVSILRFVRVI